MVFINDAKKGMIYVIVTCEGPCISIEHLIVSIKVAIQVLNEELLIDSV